VEAEAMECHGLPFSISLTLPPLALVYLRVPDAPAEAAPTPDAATADDAQEPA